MFCSKCGCELRDADVFCNKCGTKVIGASENKGMQQSSGLQLIATKCEACGAPTLKETRRGHFLCEYCGSEYITNETHEVVESKLTEKEVLDILMEAAHCELNERYYEELQCLLKAEEKASDNVILQVKIGRAYRRNNMYEEAMQCYEKAMQLDPSYANIYSNIGALYSLINQYVQAEEYLKKALAMMEENRIRYTNDDFAVCLSNYAFAVAKLGKKKEAKKLLDRAEENGYKNANAARKLLGLKKW